ncbi:MAG: DUF1553 domain-containing protein [Pedosphaera sp.]|nr:DUF1553 domain-containing protein [Pedosphaera sp.]
MIRSRTQLGMAVGMLAVSSGFVAVAAPAGKIDFNSQVRPVLSAKCFPCHGPDDKSRKAKLRLDLRSEATREREGIIPIRPGDLKNSEMIRRITAGADSDDLMPPTKAGHPLNAREIELLKKWVLQGAPYSTHWSFTKPVRPTPPKVSQRSWPKNAIDAFILAKLDANKLKPAPPADRHALIRRASLDLIGLPPTPAEVGAFVNDKSPDAFERVVDRLLSSPAYGEKWARMWMDIARYADSTGYGQDSMRQSNPWPYRDWVIAAFNRNLPLHQFTIEQLAGDLLDNPTEEQLVATAFHRNTMTNLEGGTDDEEWRVAAVKDRANVTAQAWMGLTMGCAQCHTHKFDPISQTEYYQFYAFFNQTEDNDQPDERPTMPLLNAEQRKQTADLKAQIAALEKTISTNNPELEREFAKWEQAAQGPELWRVADLKEFKSLRGTGFRKLDDGSLLADTNSPDKEIYTLKFDSSMTNATALRLEVLPDDSLPAHGPGRDVSGNFVLTELQLTVKSSAAVAQRSRFVRIELPGDKRILSLAEVQVYSGGENVATNGKASQSSVDYDGPAERAIDGKTDGEFEKAKSTTHTREEANPWWEVDLGAEQTLDSVVVWNRTDGGAGVSARLANFRLVALDAARQPVWTTQVATAPKKNVKLNAQERTAVFHRATATFEQKDLEAAHLTSGEADPKRGWAVGGAQGKAHAAVIEFSEPLPAGEVTVKLTQNFGKQHSLGRFRLALTDAMVPRIAVPENLQPSLALAADQRSPAQRQELLQWFQQFAAATAEIRRQIEPLQKELDVIKPLQLPVMRDFAADKRRVTRLMNKGNYLEPVDEVTAAVPASFNAWPADAPTNRLGLAKWLMSPENPLTARVMANRFWAQLFGVGLVETEEDFGTQGSLPTHPELLDWLAIELREGGWDVKKFLKTIVMSSTYQQSSRVTPELLAKDPRNRLLSRSPRRRLEAEVIRDQALALGGLLSPKIGGPSVYPPQPDGLWRVAFDGMRAYPTSTGEDRYRRGLYTVWRRTVPYPSMTTFDAPSRESCTFRRLPTNTPLQAYVTLNDPVYLEAAQALGRRLVREGGATVEERIRFGVNLVLSRPATKDQITALTKLFESELAHYRSAEKDALKLATEPLGALPKDLSSAEAAAWTVIANVLLNLDGVLTEG